MEYTIQMGKSESMELKKEDTQMSLQYEVSDEKRIRVILDTDAACEADDPFAIAHALMSPKLIVEGWFARYDDL